MRTSNGAHSKRNTCLTRHYANTSHSVGCSVPVNNYVILSFVCVCVCVCVCENVYRRANVPRHAVFSDKRHSHPINNNCLSVMKIKFHKPRRASHEDYVELMWQGTI
jgi:hypothetical protein